MEVIGERGKRHFVYANLLIWHVNMPDTRIQVFKIIVQSCYSLAVYHCAVQLVKHDDIKVI